MLTTRMLNLGGRFTSAHVLYWNLQHLRTQNETFLLRHRQQQQQQHDNRTAPFGTLVSTKIHRPEIF